MDDLGVEMVFDSEKYYQPMPKDDVCYFDHQGFRYYNDGTVESLDPEVDVEWDERSEYPRFFSGCFCFTVHRVIGENLWPNRPKELKFVDHIDGNRQNNAWTNLRPITVSMNNINRRSKKKPIRGWDYEDEAFLAKINQYQVKYRPTEEARNKYVARMTHKKVRYEFGAYDTPAEAHQAYLDGREEFIQAQLKDIWVSHWNL